MHPHYFQVQKKPDHFSRKCILKTTNILTTTKITVFFFFFFSKIKSFFFLGKSEIVEQKDHIDLRWNE